MVSNHFGVKIEVLTSPTVTSRTTNVLTLRMLRATRTALQSQPAMLSSLNAKPTHSRRALEPPHLEALLRSKRHCLRSIPGPSLLTLARMLLNESMSKVLIRFCMELYYACCCFLLFIVCFDSFYSVCFQVPVNKHMSASPTPFYMYC